MLGLSFLQQVAHEFANPPPRSTKVFLRFFTPARPEKFSQAGRGSYIKSVSAQLALCLVSGMEDPVFLKATKTLFLTLGGGGVPLLLLYSVFTVKPSTQTQHAHLKCTSDMDHSLGFLIHILKHEASCACTLFLCIVVVRLK